VDAGRVTPLPGEMDFETGAAFFFTYGTSLHALRDRGRLEAGETLLVLGAAGGVGLAAALLLPLCHEPARRLESGSAERTPVGRLARDLFGALARRRDLALTLVGGSLLCYGSSSTLHVVTWLVEARGMPYGRASVAAGAIGVVAGLLGNLAGGAFADACARRRPNGHLWSLLPLTAFFGFSALSFYLLPVGTPLFYLFWFLAATSTSAWFGPLFAAVQELSPPHTRATTVAFAVLALNLLGVGPGPLVTGAIGDARGLTAGLVVSVGVLLLAIVPLTLAARGVGKPTPAAAP